MDNFKKSYTLILDEIKTALDSVDSTQVKRLVDSIMDAEKVFLVGVGRVMLSLMAFCKRLNHLGIKAHCVGDINEPAITKNDLLIVGSGSGHSVIPVAIANVARKYKPKIAHIGSNPHSSLELTTDIFLRIPTKTKLNLSDELASKQPMTNMFDQSLYILCDSIVAIIVIEKNIDIKSLWKYHANLE
jgi:6-phospho-3-hexuloisomerase